MSRDHRKCLFQLREWAYGVQDKLNTPTGVHADDLGPSVFELAKVVASLTHELHAETERREQRTAGQAPATDLHRVRIVAAILRAKYVPCPDAVAAQIVAELDHEDHGDAA